MHRGAQVAAFLIVACVITSVIMFAASRTSHGNRQVSSRQTLGTHTAGEHSMPKPCSKANTSESVSVIMVDNRPLIMRLPVDNRGGGYKKKRKANEYPYWVAAVAINKRWAEKHGYEFSYYKLEDAYGCNRKGGVCGDGCTNRFLDKSTWGMSLLQGQTCMSTANLCLEYYDSTCIHTHRGIFQG